MSDKLPSLKTKEVIRIFEKSGFKKWRQKGSHLTLYRELDNKALTIPAHFSKSIPKGTLRAIIKQAGLSVEEFNLLRK